MLAEAEQLLGTYILKDFRDTYLDDDPGGNPVIL